MTAEVAGQGGVAGSIVLALPPGRTYDVACFDASTARVDETSFSVVDPTGAWVPPFDGCEESWLSSAGPYAGRVRNPTTFGELAFDKVRQADDEYRLSGYLESSEEIHVDLIRGGSGIASAAFRDEGDGWHLVGGTGPC
jgi:hypothetical protein